MRGSFPSINRCGSVCVFLAPLLLFATFNCVAQSVPPPLHTEAAPFGPEDRHVATSVDDPDYFGAAPHVVMIDPDPNLVAHDGGFEFVDSAAEANTPPDVVDVDTFPGWRFFNLDSANVTFTASITDHASAGSRAMRLAVDNPGASSSYALDQWPDGMHTVIDRDTTYIVSVDAAWVTGVTTDNLLFQIQEFDEAGTFLGNGISRTWSVGSTEYETRDVVYRPAHPDAAEAGFFFGPMRGRAGATTIDIDNIRLLVAEAPVNGDFELGPAVTAGGTGEFEDTTSFLGWRLFSAGSPPINSLTGTLIHAADYAGGDGYGRAMRLNVVNTGSPSAQDYGLDNNNALIPVTPGVTYTFSFDVALDSVTGGALNLSASVTELEAGGASAGYSGSLAPTLDADGTFHSNFVNYTIGGPGTTHVLIAFRPVKTGESVLAIDNVRFARRVNPDPPTLTFEVAAGELNLVWPESHLGWLLQSNAVDVANPALWEDVPGTAASTEQSMPLQPNSPDTFYRLKLP